MNLKIKNWVDVLNEHMVVETAQQELFALAQWGTAGLIESIEIIEMLLKKKMDEDHTCSGGASAFVHTCVLTARHKLASNRK